VPGFSPALQSWPNVLIAILAERETAQTYFPARRSNFRAASH